MGSTTFTQEIADEICERLAEGEPLRQICRDDHMPAWRTVYLWRSKNPDFDAAIARARDIGEEAILEDCLLIADNTEEGVREEEDAKGTKIVREDMLGHRKLKVETRLKLLAKWNPKRWGERIAQDVNGSMSLSVLTGVPGSGDTSDLV